jgi:protein tyrosine phosphatase (PTP) superfamily phosphohydrolase (DUF442 family)
MFRWAIERQLARGPRPRFRRKTGTQVLQSTVDAWIKEAKSRYGIRSIICLLDDQQLQLYAELPRGLVRYYRDSGFKVEHIPARNQQTPRLSDDQLRKVWKAYNRLEKPILVHCSAGIGRAGKAVSHIKQQLRFKHCGETIPFNRRISRSPEPI